MGPDPGGPWLHVPYFPDFMKLKSAFLYRLAGRRGSIERFKSSTGPTDFINGSQTLRKTIQRPLSFLGWPFRTASIGVEIRIELTTISWNGLRRGVGHTSYTSGNVRSDKRRYDKECDYTYDKCRTILYQNCRFGVVGHCFLILAVYVRYAKCFCSFYEAVG